MKITLAGDRAILEARPTPALLNVLPQLEGPRRWLKAGGLSLTPSEHNLALLGAALPGVVVLRPTEAAQEWDLAPEAGGRSFRPLTPPYAHQARALEAARLQRRFALFMEQGTGKTLVAIIRAGELWAQGAIDAVLVVAKNGVHKQWLLSQVPEHFGGDWCGTLYVAGKRPLPLGGADGLKWFSINFDALKSKAGWSAAEAFCKRHHGRIMIIADETQEIKNSKSARFKAMMKIKQSSGAQHRMILTGTPIAKDMTDEWAQLKWLDESIIGIRYISAFRNEYCLMGGFEGKAVVGHKNVERFRERVGPFLFRATKDELDIPPKIYRRWRFDLEPKQKALLSEVRKEFFALLESGQEVSAATAAVSVIRAQQISNGFVVDDDGATTSIIPPDRNPRLIALREALSSFEGPAIVWCRCREDIRLVAETFKDFGVVQYHGGTPDSERADAVQSWLAEGGPRLFVSNPQAGGTGLNLQGRCLHAIYYSNGYNAIDRWQSEDRIHRIGTKGAVTYYDLMARGGIDAGILSNLKRKGQISSLALGDIKKIMEAE